MDLFSTITGSSWVRERHLLGVEARALDRGEWDLRAVKAERKGNGLEVLDRDKGGGSVEELRERFGTGVPLVLTISGKGVVHRAVPEDKPTVKDRMDQVLPNADPEAFYFQEYRDDEGHHWGSLVRRDQVDGLLSELREAGFLVTACAIGPFHVISHWSLFFGAREEARFGPYELKRPSDGPLSVERGKEERGSELQLGQERFEAEYFLALAGLFEELLIRGEVRPAQVSAVGEDRREQDHKNLFGKGAVAAIAFFLILLLGNYIAHELASSELSQMKGELSRKEGQLQELERLEKEHASKKRTLRAVSSGTNAPFSFIADRLASRIPDPVLLTRMELAPVSEKVEEGERIRTDRDRVLLEGRTPEGSPLNRMVREFKELDPVEEASVLDYQQRERKKGAHFELELRVR